MITLTLNQILQANPCYNPQTRGLIDSTLNVNKISFREIAATVNHADTIWCFAYALPNKYNRLKRHFAVDCAERVQKLMTHETYKYALHVARNFANKLATTNDLTKLHAKLQITEFNETERTATRAAHKTAYLLIAPLANFATAQTAKTAAKAAAYAAWHTDTFHNAITKERTWQIKRLLEITELGYWEPIK
jgi:hypothetical protein